MECQGIEVRPTLAEVSVSADAALLSALLQSLLDWACEHAGSSIDLKLDVKLEPPQAFLFCAFNRRQSPSLATSTGHDVTSDEIPLHTVSWSLLHETAKALGLTAVLQDTPTRATLTMEFQNTVAPRVEGLITRELSGAFQCDPGTQALAGRHVLVLSNHRALRREVREALQPMGMLLDFVGSVPEAEAFCQDGFPHALVYEAWLAGERFEKLRSEMFERMPSLGFVQIAQEGKAFEVLNRGGVPFSSVGRGAIAESLPAAMFYEMASHLG